MEIILAPTCESLTGSLNKTHHIVVAQKDLPNGKKTMKSYLWSLELAVYDAEHE
jgi:hypothetical protein